MIGQKLSPILEEIGNTLWEFEVNGGGKPEYTMTGFRSATKIFMSAVMDKMWELQQNDKLNMDDRCNMANKVGEDIRKLVKVYTNIDTHELYNDLREKQD